MSEPVLVSRLIEAAKAHMERHGDTPVGIVLSTPEMQYAYIEPVTALGSDFYELDGPWYFEVECVVAPEEDES